MNFKNEHDSEQIQREKCPDKANVNSVPLMIKCLRLFAMEFE